jgi:hypothetical protein
MSHLLVPACCRAETFGFGGGGGSSFVSTCLGPMSFYGKSALRLAITPLCVALLLLTRAVHALAHWIARRYAGGDGGGKDKDKDKGKAAAAAADVKVGPPSRENYKRALVALVFSNLSSVFQTCLEAFACVQIGAGRYIVSAPEEACSGAAYASWTAFVGILLGLLATLVFLCFPLFLLWKAEPDRSRYASPVILSCRR